MINKKRIIWMIPALVLLAVICTGYAFFLDMQFVAGNNEMVDNWAVTHGSYLFNRPVRDDKADPVIVVFNNSGYLYLEDIDAGIDKDVIDALASRMNINYNKQVMPRARIHSMMKEGLIDITVSLIELPERAEYSYFIPYFSQKNYALVRNDLNIKSEEELLGKTEIKVGIIRSYYYGEHYGKLIEKLRDNRMIVETKDTEKLYDMLKNGWIDVAFNIPASYLYYFEALGIDDVSVMDWAPEEEPQKRCISISKKYFTQEDAQRFAQVIASMKNDGTLHEIFRKYLPEEEAKRMCDY